MSELDNLTLDEQTEMEAWLADVARNADAIEEAQEALKKSPEFITLMITYRNAPQDRARDAFRSVANFAVMFLTQRK